jgi:hypothetical protein
MIGLIWWSRGGSIQSRMRSVEPSRAALIRAAFNPFDSPQTNAIPIKKPPLWGNVIKLRKAGSHKEVGSSFFATILEIMLDK